MITLVVCGVLTFLMILSVSLLKTYSRVPLKELRRQARAKDPYAMALYKVVSYGMNLDLLLWLLIVVSSGSLFLLLSRSLTWWLGLPLVLLIIWFAFVWLPSSPVTGASEKMAQMFAPILAKTLGYLSPIFTKLLGRVRALHPVRIHTGLYEKEDLVELLNKQAGQVDNRINDAELRIAQGALSFADKSVREIMTPKRMIKFVPANETIGPLLMDELHKTGFSRFPVIEPSDDPQEQVVGTLYVKELLAHHQGGLVKSVMSKQVYYVQEEQSLLHVLDAFLKTKHHLFIVVNQFEEITGVLSIEDVLEQIIGKKIIDEFDQYDDLRAVAALQAKKHRQNAIGKHIEKQ